MALATVAGGSCGLDSLFARSLQPRNGAPVPEVTGTQQGCLSAQVPLRPLLLFSVTGNLIPARILFQFSSFAFCLYLCFTVTKEVLQFLTVLVIGEGNGNPLQRSCLKNPRDGGIWWASVYGVAQSRTRLKRLSSSSSYLKYKNILHSCSHNHLGY